MKVYVVILLQLIIWSGYTLLEWLSKHDQLIYNVLMFFIFFYLAIQIGNTIMKSAKKTIFITTFSLSLYATVHFTLNMIK
ncbi:hypothetical protein [Pseudoneobacillus sp. C159]